MSRVDRLRQARDAAQRDLDLALAQTYIAEPAEGSVISFYKRFDSGGTLYHYAAVRSPYGWHLTGRETRTFQWGDLIEFANGAELYLMISPPRAIPVESPARRARRQGRARNIPDSQAVDIGNAWHEMAEQMRAQLRQEFGEQEAVPYDMGAPEVWAEGERDDEDEPDDIDPVAAYFPPTPEVTEAQRQRWAQAVRDADRPGDEPVLDESGGYATAARNPSNPLAGLPAAEPWKLPAGPDYPDAVHGGDAADLANNDTFQAWLRRPLGRDFREINPPPGADVPMGDDIDPWTGR